MNDQEQQQENKRRNQEERDRQGQNTAVKDRPKMIKVRAVNTGQYNGRTYNHGDIFYVEESLFSEATVSLEDPIEPSKERSAAPDLDVHSAPLGHRHPGNPDIHQSNKHLAKLGWLEKVDRTDNEKTAPFVPQNETIDQKKEREFAQLRNTETKEETERRERAELQKK